MLSDKQVADFRRDGFLILRGLVTGLELRRLQEAAGTIVDAGIRFGEQRDRELPIDEAAGMIEVELDIFYDPGYLYGADGRGHRVFRRAEWLWERDEIFGLAAANPKILNAVWQLLETPFIPTNDSLVVKVPGAGTAIPWHRDVQFEAITDVGGDPCRDFTIDLYLDPSTRDNGCLWAIPGSHLGATPPEDPNDWERTDAIALAAEPGDVFVHATALLHSSPPNSSPALRRTVYFHYRGPSGLSAASTHKSIRIARRCEPVEFIQRQFAFLTKSLADRDTAGFDDDERYAGPVALPEWRAD